MIISNLNVSLTQRLCSTSLKTKFSTTLFFALFLCIQSVYTQKVISGTVTGASDGELLIGANVTESGTLNGTVTDLDGKFSIAVSEDCQFLDVSYIGYSDQRVSVAGDIREVMVSLSTGEILEEVVVIGYTPVSRKKILGSVSSLKSEAMEQATPVQAFDAVQGRLAGVQILSNNGPGSGFDIRIRGVSTFGSGTQPLYVVDGQQLDNIDNLNPADIESMEVLKDGATAAIYGSKAANGVVLISTKSGKSGQLKVDVSSIVGRNSLVGDLQIANTKQRILYEKLRSNDPSALTAQESDSLSQINRNSYDLQDLLTRPAIRSQTNLAISGGENKVKFYWNTGYLTEQGIVNNSGYERVNTQIKFDINASKRLKFGARSNLSYEYQNGISTGSVLQHMVERIPYYPLFEPNGDFTPQLFGRQNPLAHAELRTVDNRNYRTQVFSYAQLNILPKLSFKSTVGVNLRFNKRDDFRPGFLVGNDGVGDSDGRERQDINYDIQQENFLNYINSFGRHNIAAFAGMQIQKYYREYSDFRSIFNNDIIQTFNNSTPGTITSSSFNSRHNLFSLFAGFNYDFDNKYLIGATVRRDGSSRFGDENEYGIFPSATLGWRISDESFLKDNVFINNLLLKASWGIVGNERVGNYEFIGAYEPGFVYNGISGIAPTRLGNSELSWEETESANLGIDLSILKNRVDISLDFWQKNTTGLLALTPLPEESGFSGIRRNVGAVDNRGIDFSITGAIIRTKDFSWKSNFNIGFLDNEVTKLDGGIPFESGQFRVEEGQPIGNIFGYMNLGIYQYDESNAYTPDGVQLTPNFDYAGQFLNYTLNGSEYSGEIMKMKAANQVLAGGDIIWDDIDGNFVIDADDRQILGNGLATVYGGFSQDLEYKNFGLSILFDYNLGQDIYRRYDETRNDLNSSNETPGPDRILGSWKNPGDITEYPRLTRVPQNRLRPNSFYVTDGGFIKWRYVRLNYRFSDGIIKNIPGLRGASLNLAVNNVLTWTNYIGYNPELGNRGNALQPNVDNLRYPNDREVIAGLKIQF